MRPSVEKELQARQLSQPSGPCKGSASALVRQLDVRAARKQSFQRGSGTVLSS
jgi:hypothetical protein